MKTVDQIIQATKGCENNGKIYLLDIISDISGIFCSDGDILYLVINKEGCRPLSITTEFLQMDTDVYVQSFDEKKSFPDAEYNILRYKGSGIDGYEDNVESFINLCVAHTKLLKGESFEQFFYSLISLFQLPKEQTFLNLMGLFGELSVIREIYKSTELDVSPFWHADGSFSKYDFALPNRNSIEVKSSSKGDKAVGIKHAQLFSLPQRVCLASVQVIEDNSGWTVEELINEMRKDSNICNNLQFELSLQKELKRVSPDEVKSKRFVTNSVHFFLNSSINPFPVLPDNVNGIEYIIDLSESKVLSQDALIEFLS